MTSLSSVAVASVSPPAQFLIGFSAKPFVSGTVVQGEFSVLGILSLSPVFLSLWALPACLLVISLEEDGVGRKNDPRLLKSLICLAGYK